MLLHFMPLGLVKVVFLNGAHLKSTLRSAQVGFVLFSSSPFSYSSLIFLSSQKKKNFPPMESPLRNFLRRDNVYKEKSTTEQIKNLK